MTAHVGGPTAAQPLRGTLVVSLEQAVAAPLATRHLADLGARVIKIERAGVGDFARGYDESVEGQSSYFLWLNRGKESVTLDVKSDLGRAALRELLVRADVFVSNLGPGAVERLGWHREALMELNPRLVQCTISGYGTGSTWDDRKAYDLLLQCETGLTDVTGSAEQPAKVGISIVDISAGMYAFSGILSSLHAVVAGLTPAPLEISLFDSIVEWMSGPALFTQGSGAAPERVGMRHATIAPYGPFVCEDGQTVTLAIQNEREWAALCAHVLGRADLADDPRFVTNTLRVAHRDVLEPLIASIVSTITSDRLVELLERHRIANGRVNTVAELLHHPVLTERSRWATTITPAGPVEMIRPPFVYTGEAPTALGAVPALGEHTRTVLAELGLDTIVEAGR